MTTRPHASQRVLFALCTAAVAAFASIHTAVADYLLVPSQYPTIEAAVAASAPGDHIVLADGVHQGTGNHDIEIPSHALTIRSASGLADGCVIQLERDISAGVAQRAFHFTASSSSQTVLQEVTIRGGGGERTGGAVLIQGSSPTIRACIFEDNRATGICDATWGGAVFTENSNARLEDCVFRGNTAGPEPCGGMGDGYGGAVQASGGAPMLVDCLFDSNFISVSDFGIARGAAVSALFGAEVYLINSRFTNNWLDGGEGEGGALWVLDATIHAIGCVLEGNRANTSGEFIGAGGAAAARVGGALNLVNCLVRGNTASRSPASSAHGGAISIRTGSLTATNTLFAENTASSATSCTFGDGGFGGAIHLDRGVTVTIRSSTFAGNSAQCEGGAIYASPAFGTVDIRNTILWGNGAAPIASTGPADIRIQFSDIEGGGWPGLGNIDANPMFTGPGADDYTLGAGSPAADAGANHLVPADTYDLDGDGDTAESLPIDLASSPRFTDDPAAPDTGAGAAPIVDMGAYEFPASCYADCDASGSLDFFDFLCFQNLFAAEDPQADCDSSGDLDFFDFLCFQNAFAAGCP